MKIFQLIAWSTLMVFSTSCLSKNGDSAKPSTSADSTRMTAEDDSVKGMKDSVQIVEYTEKIYNMYEGKDHPDGTTLRKKGVQYTWKVYYNDEGLKAKAVLLNYEGDTVKVNTYEYKDGHPYCETERNYDDSNHAVSPAGITKYLNTYENGLLVKSIKTFSEEKDGAFVHVESKDHITNYYYENGKLTYKKYITHFTPKSPMKENEIVRYLYHDDGSYEVKSMDIDEKIVYSQWEYNAKGEKIKVELAGMITLFSYDPKTELLIKKVSRGQSEKDERTIDEYEYKLDEHGNVIEEIQHSRLFDFSDWTLTTREYKYKETK